MGLGWLASLPCLTADEHPAPPGSDDLVPSDDPGAERPVASVRLGRPQRQATIPAPNAMTRTAAPPTKTADAAPKARASAPNANPPTGVEPAKTVV